MKHLGESKAISCCWVIFDFSASLQRFSPPFIDSMKETDGYTLTGRRYSEDMYKEPRKGNKLHHAIVKQVDKNYYLRRTGSHPTQRRGAGVFPFKSNKEDKKVFLDKSVKCHYATRQHKHVHNEKVSSEEIINQWKKI